MGKNKEESSSDSSSLSSSSSISSSSSLSSSSSPVPKRGDKGGKKGASKAAAKKGGKRKRKDPDAPKKPLSSYMFYMAARRNAVASGNPELKFGDIARKVSEEWKALDAETKKEYEDKAAADRVRYEQQMKGYTPPDDSDDDGPKRKKAKKDPNAPKRAQNAYMFFVNEFREKIKAEGGPTKPTEVGKLAGERWRSMSADEKKPFEDKAAADKERATREMAAYTGKA